MTKIPATQRAPKEAMTHIRALTLALLTLEWEIETAAQNQAGVWANECREAVAVLRRMVKSTRPLGSVDYLTENPEPPLAGVKTE